MPLLPGTAAAQTVTVYFNAVDLPPSAFDNANQALNNSSTPLEFASNSGQLVATISNGLSETGELSTLGSLGIASISLTKKTNNQPLPGGNQIADLGTYTRTDGSTGTVGEVSKLADVNLAVDTFYRQFPDSVALAAGVTGLPNMQGSGLVRDLWEAMSQSADLKALVSQFAAATSKAAQMAIMDRILTAWADTSGLKATLEERLPTRSDSRDAPGYRAHALDLLRQRRARNAIPCGFRRGGLRGSLVDAGRGRVGVGKRGQGRTHSGYCLYGGKHLGLPASTQLTLAGFRGRQLNHNSNSQGRVLEMRC